MKRILVLFVALGFITLFGRAQETDNDLRSNLMVGIKMGLNLSNVYDSKDQTFSSNPKFGLAAGGFISVPFTKLIGLQPELLFSQKGFQTTGNFLGGHYTLTRTSNFIDIPILLAIKPTSQITILAGPQYSYLVKETDVFTNSTISITDEQQFNNNNIRRNTFCFLGGMDVTLSHLVIGGRVGWDILDNNGDGTSTTPRYKNVWYQATVGYRFF